MINMIFDWLDRTINKPQAGMPQWHAVYGAMDLPIPPDAQVVRDGNNLIQPREDGTHCIVLVDVPTKGMSGVMAGGSHVRTSIKHPAPMNIGAWPGRGPGGRLGPPNPSGWACEPALNPANQQWVCSNGRNCKKGKLALLIRPQDKSVLAEPVTLFIEIGNWRIGKLFGGEQP